MEEKKLDKDINVRSKTELSDEEIIKTLEVCMSGKGCEVCPYFENGIDCVRRSEKDTLDLIHRLQIENEKLSDKNATLEYENSELKQRVSILEADNDDYKNKIAENELVSIDWHNEQVGHLEEEIERLTKRLELADKDNDNLAKTIFDYEKQVDELKAKQVIECHGMLKGCDMVNQAVKDTAKEIFSFIINQYDGEYFLHNVEQFINKKYGLEVE